MRTGRTGSARKSNDRSSQNEVPSSPPTNPPFQLIHSYTSISSNLETSDSSLSDTEPDQNRIPVDVTAAYKRGPQQVVYKGNQFIWKEHDDNESAFTKSSIIWRLGDEHERVGNNCVKKYWRCGLCKKTTLLAMKNTSRSGIKDKKKKKKKKKQHKIGKQGQRIRISQTTLLGAVTTAGTVISTAAMKIPKMTGRVICSLRKCCYTIGTSSMP